MPLVLIIQAKNAIPTIIKQKNTKMAAKTKAEVAMMYFPDLSKESALKSFRRLMMRDPVLKNEVMKTLDYNSTHFLSPKMVMMIFDKLGDPQSVSNSRRFDRMDREKKLFG